MAKNKNRDRKQQQRQNRPADRAAGQPESSPMETSSQQMQPDGGPSSTPRKDRNKSFGHN